MSDLSQAFIVSVGGAAGTSFVTVPTDADLVQVTAGLDAAGSTASTVDVQVNGTTVFSAAGTTVAGVNSTDVGGTITSNKVQFAGDSATKALTAKATSSVKAGMATAVTNNVTSGIDFWAPVAPNDAVLKACKAGDIIKVVTTTGTGVTTNAVGLLFHKK